MSQTTMNPVLLQAAAIADMPWEPLDKLGLAVSHKVLWHEGASMAGVMQLGPGGRVDEHTHAVAHHHLWVIEGVIEVAGVSVDAGGYAHVPAGVAHAMVNPTDRPARFLYLYLKS